MTYPDTHIEFSTNTITGGDTRWLRYRRHHHLDVPGFLCNYF